MTRRAWRSTNAACLRLLGSRKGHGDVRKKEDTWGNDPISSFLIQTRCGGTLWGIWAIRRELGFNGLVVTRQRLKDALYRILGCKAAIGLHRKKAKGQIPLSPAKYKKIRVFVLSANVGNQKSIYGQGVQSGGSDRTTGYIMDALGRCGYEPVLMESSMEKGKTMKCLRCLPLLITPIT